MKTVNQNKKFRWIREEIVLDFDIPRVMQNEIAEAEQYDREGNLALYLAVADGLDVLAKSYYASGRISERQWVDVCNKYPGYWGVED